MLGFMSLEFFRRSPLLAYPLAALVIFMAVFLIVTVRALLSQKTRWETVSQLPLDGERNERGLS